jgi:PAS domain S-box-containing protein
MDIPKHTNYDAADELNILRQRVAELEQQLSQQQSSSTGSSDASSSSTPPVDATIVRILESISDPLFALDLEWRFVYVNRRFEEVSMRSHKALLGQCIWQVFPEAVETPFYGQYHRAIAEQVAVVVEASQPDEAGNWYEAHAYPHADGLVVYFRNINNRKLIERERDRLLKRANLEVANQLQSRQQIEQLLANLQQKEIALKESEERLQLAVKNSPLTVFTQDQDLHYTWIYNPTFDYPAERVIGQRDEDLVSPADAALLTGIKRRVLETGVGTREEVKLTVQDRSWYYDLTVEPLHDSTGAVVGITCACVDISERKQIEAELERLLISEQAARAEAETARKRLTTVFETSPIGIAFLDHEQRFVSINEALAEINGLSREQHLGRSIAELFGSFDSNIVRVFNQIYATGEPFISPNLPVNVPGRSDRSPGYYNVYYLPTKPTDSPHVEGVLVYVVDVTERVRLERVQHYLSEVSTVLASSLDYQTTLERVAQLTVPELADWCTVHIKEEGTIEQLAIAHIDPAKIEWAKQLREKYPFNPNDPRGAAFTLRTGKSELLSHIPDELLVQAARDPEHLQILREVGFRSVMTVPLRSQEQVWGVISFVSAESGRQYDQHDLLMAEELAQRASLAIDNARLYRLAQRDRAQAEAANRIKDEFLAVLSHELRTPLNPILGWTSLLRSREYDRETLHRALETIERNARLQTQLIEDLLDISRILQGKLRLDVAPVNLATTITAALETVRLSAEAKSIHMQTAIAPGGRAVLGDASRLQQVLWNLLSNAIKFTPQGGRVEIRLEYVDTQALVTVSDTGRGISPDFLPFIFDAFRQADGKITRQFGGLGLGLSIARHLVELHGGSIRAESAGDGQGATFVVKLPLMVESSPLEQNCMDVDQSVDLNGLRILAVDDDVDNLELVTFILEQAGASVTSAKLATEALTILEQPHLFDILVSDIGMPGMDGYTLLQKVRLLPAYQESPIPAIALTAYAAEYDQQQALAAGYQMHIAKPIEPEDLVHAIDQLVPRRNAIPNT